MCYLNWYFIVNWLVYVEGSDFDRSNSRVNMSMNFSRCWCWTVDKLPLTLHTEYWKEPSVQRMPWCIAKSGINHNQTYTKGSWRMGRSDNLGKFIKFLCYKYSSFFLFHCFVITLTYVSFLYQLYSIIHFK
jgi:hypothetical protein